jgi:hypothetical protein
MGSGAGGGGRLGGRKPSGMRGCGSPAGRGMVWGKTGKASLKPATGAAPPREGTATTIRAPIAKALRKAEITAPRTCSLN